MSYDPATVFHGTAWYYARYRPGYIPALFDHLVNSYRLDPATRVVDVGTGTGQIAVPLAKREIPVVAIDPEPEMLIEARAFAQREGVGERITLLEGRGEDLLNLVNAPIRLVTFGAAFHWTDREHVLSLCDQLVDESGGVAVVSGGKATKPLSDDIAKREESRPSWVDVVAEVVQQFLGPRRRAGTGFYSHPDDRHEQVLQRSKFERVKVWRGKVQLVRTVDEVIGLQYSTSYCSPALLGDRKSEFERVLRSRLLELDPSNRFIEDYEIEALCARRA